ncbi:MAG TPA: 50S ribosomal protein L2 [Candidatus Moranbacteria bacterium]|nr:50S ribosomal protein L2 [Candidatus Moranbacteria bacterium]
MAVKIYKKNSAGRRKMSIIKPAFLTDQAPERTLLVSLSKKAGRSKGKISVRNRGGGAKRNYRLIDFKFNKKDVPGKVVSIEKDPNRSALIALIHYPDGEKRYILATENMKRGEEVLVSEKAPIKEGNRLALKNIPIGTMVCAVEMIPGKGVQMARSAGAGVVLQALDAKMATLKMPSGEIRMVSEKCYATIGQISNFEHSTYRIGKAGRSRHLGRRPHVRGSAMNPVDHPHGGGEGRQPIGLKYPKTPWGKPALGVKTRKKKRHSSRLIVKRRAKKR